MESPSAMRLLLLLVVCCALLVPQATARPPHRQKRVSDQRLAELETLLALAKMNNRKYVTLPVGFGLIDVKQIGRRKRSAVVDADQDFLQQVDEYDLGELISALNTKNENEESGLEDVAYPTEDLTLQQEVRRGRQTERMKTTGRPAPPSPALLYGLRNLPRRRYI